MVYGGSDAGLMRIVASSVLANGGRVTGVHPEGIRSRLPSAI
ncbi:MAG: hypothetical protein L6W00_12985 [Lentisphaeria bacterium]|nr:MAG: hypothetical protein L6W00_12985 [Lentisphaeria bacterium]